PQGRKDRRTAATLSKNRVLDLYDSHERDGAGRPSPESRTRSHPSWSFEVYHEFDRNCPEQRPRAGSRSSLRVPAHGRADGRAHAVIGAFVPPSDGGPPAATHLQQEKMFLVVEGLVEFFVGCERILVAAGGTAYAPRGISHRFVNVGPTP